VPVKRRGNNGKVRLMDLEPTVRRGILSTFIQAETDIRKFKNPELN
jgi:hypothetical protein